MQSQCSHVLLQQLAQALQSSYQSAQHSKFELQQQLYLMQQSGLLQQQVSLNAQQQPFHVYLNLQPQPAYPAFDIAQSKVMPLAASAISSMPITTAPIVSLTCSCSWTEHTSPQELKYYYSTVTKEINIDLISYIYAYSGKSRKSIQFLSSSKTAEIVMVSAATETCWTAASVAD
ncbi:flowering time control protein FCA-like [Asparagus officinalis]|uniref:flowering time control protein FCA-like n=1 Tax=Asparagus officinalis TaxID=4686 RepID=UPI00098E1E0B|nr:flowering time control protein FCA-like [Asparagus officinalis]